MRVMWIDAATRGLCVQDKQGHVSVVSFPVWVRVSAKDPSVSGWLLLREKRRGKEEERGGKEDKSGGRKVDRRITP